MKTAKTHRDLLLRFLNGDANHGDIAALSKRCSTIMTDLLHNKIETSVNFDSKDLSSFKDSFQGFIADVVKAQIESDSLIRRLISPLTILLPSFPELVFPLGYDEIRFNTNPVNDPTTSESARDILNEIKNAHALESEEWSSLLSLWQNIQFRSMDGVWRDSEGLFDKILPPQETSGGGEQRTENKWIDIFKSSLVDRFQNQLGVDQKIICLPSLPLSTSFGDSELHKASKRILCDLNLNNKPLAEIHWRTLEEIVAELLFDLGMEVFVTDRSGDGGRDVIAKGELIPGEPTVLAVEVKHKAVVPVADVRQTLWANRHIPALLFVTSGRFSSGVYLEKRTNESFLRLFLKDGHGLQQWINNYVDRTSI